jgi:hypothetical protein
MSEKHSTGLHCGPQQAFSLSQLFVSASSRLRAGIGSFQSEYSRNSFINNLGESYV